MDVDWDTIVREHGPAIYRIAWRITGHADDADDVVQESFLEAHRTATRGGVENWLALLKRIAVCRSLDRIRRHWSEVSIDEVAIASPDPAPESEILRSELETRLRASLGELPEREATVFCMRHFDQLSIAEIATALEISASAVTTALHKARLKLSSKLSVHSEGARS